MKKLLAHDNLIHRWITQQLAANNNSIQRVLINWIKNPVTPFSVSPSIHISAKQILLALVKSGASLDLNIEFCGTSLHIAIHSNQNKITRLILEETQHILDQETYEKFINSKCQSNFTALHIATANNDQKTVALLIKFNANINTLNFFKVSPLMIAIQNKNIAIVRLLLNAGAAQTTGRSSCLHIATKEFAGSADIQSITIVKELLKFGADVTAKDHHNVTALNIAIQYNNHFYSPIEHLIAMIEIYEKNIHYSETVSTNAAETVSRTFVINDTDTSNLSAINDDSSASLNRITKNRYERAIFAYETNHQIKDMITEIIIARMSPAKIIRMIRESQLGNINIKKILTRH